MKIQVSSRELKRALSVVSGSVARNPTLPVLANLLIDAKEDKVIFATTDLEIFAVENVSAIVKEEGSITVPFKKLDDLAKTLPESSITMEDQFRLRWKQSGRPRRASFLYIPSDKFPMLPPVPDTDWVELSPTIFQDMVRRVVFAAATNETRPILTGILFEIKADQFKMVSADGFRLSVAIQGIDKGAEIKVIVPAKVMDMVGRLIMKEKCEKVSVAISESKNQILFKLDPGTLIVSQLLDGSFISYASIIPKSHETRVVVPTGEFIQALKQAQVYIEDKGVVNLDIGTETIQITTDTGLGEYEGDILVEVEGEPIKIAFQITYLLEGLMAIGTSKVVLKLLGASRPGVILPENSSDEFTHVIMPMHLRD